MKNAIPILFLVVASGSVVLAQEVAFVNVTVLPMDSERVLEGHTVLIRGDRIVAVGPSDEIQPSNGAVSIDGTGKFLIPGLAEMHGHVPRPDEQAQHTEDVLFLYLANGITTVRGMQGAAGQLELRERARSGEITSPNLYLAGPAFSGGSIDSPQQAEERVRHQKKEGWDLLKVLPGLSVEEYDAMARTAREVGIRFAGHVPAEVGIMHAIDEGQDSFDHLDGYVEYLRSINADAMDDEALSELIRRTKEAGAFVVPTMALWEVLNGTIDMEDLRAYDETKYMPSATVASWFQRVERQLGTPSFDRAGALRLIDARMHVLRTMHENDVQILMGTDAPQLFSVPGFSLHRELARMVKAGMSPYAILVSGTRNVGEYFVNQDQFGTITIGSRADLLLVEDNPWDDVSHVRNLAGVMVRGRWLPRGDIDSHLARIAPPNARNY